MDEFLKNKFLQKKLDDLLNDTGGFLPTIICERDDPKIIDIVRRNIFIAIEHGGLVPFTSDNIRPPISERLDTNKGQIQWGELYIDVNIN